MSLDNYSLKINNFRTDNVFFSSISLLIQRVFYLGLKIELFFCH
jgi:hypothetical protein